MSAIAVPKGRTFEIHLSRNPIPSRILGANFSTRALLVFACLAPEMCRLYSRCQPGLRDSNAALKTVSLSRRCCSSSARAAAESFNNAPLKNLRARKPFISRKMTMFLSALE